MCGCTIAAQIVCQVCGSSKEHSNEFKWIQRINTKVMPMLTPSNYRESCTYLKSKNCDTAQIWTRFNENSLTKPFLFALCTTAEESMTSFKYDVWFYRRRGFEIQNVWVRSMFIMWQQRSILIFIIQCVQTTLLDNNQKNWHVKYYLQANLDFTRYVYITCKTPYEKRKLNYFDIE